MTPFLEERSHDENLVPTLETSAKGHGDKFVVDDRPTLCREHWAQLERMEIALRSVDQLVGA